MTTTNTPEKKELHRLFLESISDETWEQMGREFEAYVMTHRSNPKAKERQGK